MSEKIMSTSEEPMDKLDSDLIVSRVSRYRLRNYNILYVKRIAFKIDHSKS